MKVMTVANVIDASRLPPKTSLIVKSQNFAYWLSRATHSTRLDPRNDQEKSEETSIGCSSFDRRAGSFLFTE